MNHILLAAHILITLALVIVVLLQKSSGATFGSSTPTGGLMTARGGKTFFTRLTAILATIFIINSLVLAILAKQDKVQTSIIDTLPATTSPVAPITPQVPMAK